MTGTAKLTHPETRRHRSHRRDGRRRRVARGRAFLLLAIVLGVFAAATPAGAHSIEQSYLYIDIYETEIEGRLEFNVNDVNDVLGLSLPTDSSDLPALDAAVEAVYPEILAYAQANFGLGSEGQPWEVAFRDDHELLSTNAGLFVILPFDVEERFAAPPETIDVRYEPFLEEDPNHRGFFLIANYWQGGVFGNEGSHLLIFDADSTQQTTALADPSFIRGLLGVVELGIDHIRIGTDHILFVVALLLPAVLVFSSNTWHPAASFRDSLWRILKIASMFTLAHSITLSLAGFGIIELPSKPVETIIAISIILAALHNFRPMFANREWLLAFGFGLFHGLGFAGLLSDLGLDRSNRVWSLFAFNLGVEVGQAAIIMLLFPALYILRGTRLYAVGFKLASALLAVVAAFWAVERLTETDLKINKFIDPLVKVPRAYVLIAVVTALAWAWRRVETRRGWLRPSLVAATSEPEDRAALDVTV